MTVKKNVNWEISSYVTGVLGDKGKSFLQQFNSMSIEGVKYSHTGKKGE
jgi:hypothetical protein